MACVIIAFPYDVLPTAEYRVVLAAETNQVNVICYQMGSFCLLSIKDSVYFLYVDADLDRNMSHSVLDIFR